MPFPFHYPLNYFWNMLRSHLANQSLPQTTKKAAPKKATPKKGATKKSTPKKA
jgi:hypothetical protein